MSVFCNTCGDFHMEKTGIHIYIYVCMYVRMYVCMYVCIHIYIYIHTYMVYTTEGFFEVATESWPGWNLNSRPLNSVQTL